MKTNKLPLLKILGIISCIFIVLLAVYLIFKRSEGIFFKLQEALCTCLVVFIPLGISLAASFDLGDIPNSGLLEDIISDLHRSRNRQFCLLCLTIFITIFSSINLPKIRIFVCLMILSVYIYIFFYIFGEYKNLVSLKEEIDKQKRFYLERKNEYKNKNNF